MLEIYATEDSVEAGGTIQFRGRSGPEGNPAVSFRVEIARVGATGWSASAKGSARGAPVPPEFYLNGCGWPVILTVRVPETARSGAYVATFTTAKGKGSTSTQVSFVVKTPPSQQAARILVVFPTATTHAYNSWGDFGAYVWENDKPKSGKVTLNRPSLWVAADSGPFIRWLEEFVPAVDYATSIDLHRRESLLARYSLFVSVGHDEYWSAKMRDEVEEFVARGGHACFLSGNTCWWQVRFEIELSGDPDVPGSEPVRRMVCYKDADDDRAANPGLDPALVTTNWYRSPPGRPENSLTCVSYRHGGLQDVRPLPACSYRVHDAGHWVFDGADLGDGHFGGKILIDDPVYGALLPRLPFDQVVGYECDGATFRSDGDRLYPTGEDGSPTDLRILASAPLGGAIPATTLFLRNASGGITEYGGVGLAARDRSQQIRVTLGPSAVAGQDELVVQWIGGNPGPIWMIPFLLLPEHYPFAVSDFASLVLQINRESRLVSAVLLTDASEQRLYHETRDLAGFGHDPAYPLGTATMAIHERKGRGTVFTVGTVDWTGRLGAPWDAVAQITRNVLTRLSVPSITTNGAAVTAIARYPAGDALDVFVTSRDGHVVTAYYNDNGVPWNGWHQVTEEEGIPGGAPPGAPVSVLSRFSTGKALDVFVTANDGRVYTAYYNDDGVPWNGWFALGGERPVRLPPGAPVSALARYPSGDAIDLFVCAADGRVYTAYYNDRGVPWTEWIHVVGPVPGGLPAGAPVGALARYPGGEALDIWVTAGDGQVYTAYYNDALDSWFGWFPVAGPIPGGVAPGAPVAAIARYRDGTGLDVFVTGNDGQVYTAFYNDADVPWDGWYPIEGPVPGNLPAGAPVSVVSRYPDGKALDIWVTSGDGQVYAAYYNDDLDSWYGWFPIARRIPTGIRAGAPVAALSRYPTGHVLDLFVVGDDGRLDTATYSDATDTWNGWSPIPTDD